MTRSATLAVLALALLLAGCFEEPVRQDLELRLAADGKAQVELTTTLSDHEREGNPVLASRLDETRRRLLLGEDEWSPRFERLRPETYDTSFHREDGLLAEAEQKAAVDLADDPDALGRFFSDTLVEVAYRPEDGWSELSFQPLAAGRLGRRDRDRLDRAIDSWTEALATYFRAAAKLWAYLDRRPDRAEAVFSELFRDALPDEIPPRSELLTTEEDPLVQAVEDARDEATGILEIEEREAFTINELSRLAFDPFPAHLSLSLPGPVIEAEGFVKASDGTLVVPGVDLWDALASLEGVWLAPDPLLILVRQIGSVGGEAAEDFSLAGVLAVERRAADPPPTAGEIRSRIVSRLEPRPYYRVVWKTG